MHRWLLRRFVRESLRGASYPLFSTSRLAAEGWYLTDVHERWLRNDEATLISVPVSELVSRDNEPIEDVDSHGSTVQGIVRAWRGGYRVPVIEGMQMINGSIKLADGRHRLVAARVEGKQRVPVVVGV